MADKDKYVTILGSTGSIGVQSLDVLDSADTEYRVAYLTANTNIELLAAQVNKYKPLGVAIRDEKAYREFKKNYSFDCKLYHGEEGIIEVAGDKDNDLVISALVGFSGVIPTLTAIYSGTTVALANKETLVSAGKIVMDAARANNTAIIAVDSEHSAVLQCLAGEDKENIEKLILTASGGPFLNVPACEFPNITVEQALSHPNWSMGNKITIDSATMMNKGFEVIEAYWLFGVDAKNIEVLIHPQSIIHSLVQFNDGSVKAQLGLPDMHLPILYAFSYPHRLRSNFNRLSLADVGSLSFLKPDFEKYRCLQLAYEALSTGGNAPTVLNAANEIAVSAFLNNTISFDKIPLAIEKVMNMSHFTVNPGLDEIIESDINARDLCRDIINNC